MRPILLVDFKDLVKYLVSIKSSFIATVLIVIVASVLKFTVKSFILQTFEGF